MLYADPMLNEDYTLLSGSPCIDSGSSACTDPDGTVCDIGVFYFAQQTTDVTEEKFTPQGYALHPN